MTRLIYLGQHLTLAAAISAAGAIFSWPWLGTMLAWVLAGVLADDIFQIIAKSARG